MQTKEIKVFITSGVESLSIEEDLMIFLMNELIPLFKLHGYFISLHQDANNIKVTDGNNNLIHTIVNNIIPENLWFILDDYDEYFVATLLLPSEY